MRKTKIVCTIGPACDSKEMMRKMIDAGMNVARINMSHGVYDRLEVTIKNLKEAIAESGQNVAILLDTKGPEVRVGTFKDGSVELVEGAEFSLFKNKEEGDETGVSLSFPKLVDIFESEGQEAIGRELLLDDGIISLVVKSVNPESIVCTVNKGGVLKNRKSINIPGYFINMPYVSAQDRKDIEFGLNHGATVVAASLSAITMMLELFVTLLTASAMNMLKLSQRLKIRAVLTIWTQSLITQTVLWLLEEIWVLKFRLSSCLKSRKQSSERLFQEVSM